MQLPPLTQGILLKRYKRFLADIDFNGTIETVHCPNPGAMTGLKETGLKVWCSSSDNPNRKLKKTLELVEVNDTLVGINTNLPNKLVYEALQLKKIPDFIGYPNIEAEFTYEKGTRFDFRLSNDETYLFLEVKNVHLSRHPKALEFPDSVTARGAKHLNKLAEISRAGGQAAMLYVIQREDGDYFTLADDIDPNYAIAFNEARQAGVQMLAWQCSITTTAITINKAVPVVFEAH